MNIPDDVTGGIELLGHFFGLGLANIAQERARQVNVEGFTLEHDDEWTENQLALAAISYLWPTGWQPPDVLAGEGVPSTWPFEATEWKPKDRLHNLVIAGALVAAEIDRQLRIEANPEADTSIKAKIHDEGINAKGSGRWRP